LTARRLNCRYGTLLARSVSGPSPVPTIRVTVSLRLGAHALIITFDITNKTSFTDAIKYWYSEIKSQCPPDTDVLLVGNKADLEERREVTKE
jgi:GTPase SAR1 family protein